MTTISEQQGITRRPVKVQSNFERNAFMFMRLSGIALLLLAVGHMMIQHVVNSSTNLTIQFVAEQWNSWGWKLFVGVLGIIAGIIVLQNPIWSSVLVPTVLVIILGIQGIIIGVVNIVQAFQGAGWGAGILGALSIVLGLVLLANAFVASFALAYVLGIFMIIGGIAAVVMAFRLK